MKVKISYTVELDEVPSQVYKYLNSVSGMPLDTGLTSIIELIKQGNIEAAIDDIDIFRKDLARLDLKLDDAQSILDGYMKARYGSSEGEKKDGTQEV